MWVHKKKNKSSVGKGRERSHFWRLLQGTGLFSHLFLHMAPTRVPVNVGRVLLEQGEELRLYPLCPLFLLKLKDKAAEERLAVSTLVHAPEANVSSVALLKLRK